MVQVEAAGVQSHTIVEQGVLTDCHGILKGLEGAIIENRDRVAWMLQDYHRVVSGLASWIESGYQDISSVGVLSYRAVKVSGIFSEAPLPRPLG